MYFYDWHVIEPYVHVAYFMDCNLHSDSEVSHAQDLDAIDECPRSESENRSEISDLDPVIAGPGDHDKEVEDWEAE